MPYVCVRGQLGEVKPETKVFGLPTRELDELARFLDNHGGKIGPDGTAFSNTPVQILDALQFKFNYKVIIMPYVVVRGNLGMANTKVYGLADREIREISKHLQPGKFGPSGDPHVGVDGITFYNSPVLVMNQLEFHFGYKVVAGSAQAMEGNEARVRELLEKGHAVNGIDATGYAPLHYAARNGHVSVCRLLLDSGADVNLPTRAGSTSALLRAALRGHESVLKLLLDQGADPRLRDSDGKTALHKAAEQGHVSIVKELLSRCPELRNIPDNKGRCAKDYTHDVQILQFLS
ncbi:unnamed protein product [Darwinula stevensoni]|uniref:Uncharacterized protein n=1 Tax=Darwinula stevensoni TaxID=69355 RepID=A0A7R8XCA0_9CRUS|nr:unnamed protein product [Darwinula stevensoni]CAG0893572.1 unnamed protein product [Darwinula stevensoni]